MFPQTALTGPKDTKISKVSNIVKTKRPSNEFNRNVTREIEFPKFLRPIICATATFSHRKSRELLLLIDMLEQLIWKCSHYGGAAKWSRDGQICVLSKEGVQVFIPYHGVANMFACKWIEISSTGIGTPENPMPHVVHEHDLLEWLSKPGSGETRFDMSRFEFKQACFTPYGFCGRPCFLTLLSGDGSLFVCDCLQNGLYHHDLRLSESIQLAMKGIVVVLDLSLIVPQTTTETNERLDTFHRFFWHPDVVEISEVMSMLLYVASHSTITCWQVYQTQTGNIGARVLTSYPFELPPPIADTVAKELPPSLSNGISCITAMNLSEDITDSGTPEFHTTILLGSVNGHVKRVDLKTNLGTANIDFAWEEIWHRDLRCSSRVEFIESAGDGLIAIAAGTEIYIIQFSDSLMFRLETLHTDSISSLTPQVAWTQKEISSSPAIFLTSSFDGKVIAWSCSRPEDDSISLAATNVNMISMTTGCLGLALDPLGLILAQVKVVPPLTDSSKEVQVNGNVDRVHSAVDFFRSPSHDPTSRFLMANGEDMMHLDDEWALNLSGVKDKLKSIVFAEGYVTEVCSLAGFSFAYVQSLESSRPVACMEYSVAGDAARGFVNKTLDLDANDEERSEAGEDDADSSDLDVVCNDDQSPWDCQGDSVLLSKAKRRSANG